MDSKPTFFVHRTRKRSRTSLRYHWVWSTSIFLAGHDTGWLQDFESKAEAVAAARAWLAERGVVDTDSLQPTR